MIVDQIMPLPARFRSANTERRAVTSAVIQGYMLDRWRAYGRIFGDLVRQVKGESKTRASFETVLNSLQTTHLHG